MHNHALRPIPYDPMGTGETPTTMNGSPSVNTNLSFTRFLFVTPHEDDGAMLARLRAVGASIGRGFFNDFDADGSRDVQPRETIQFLTADGPVATRQGLGAARYAVQISANYRPRLQGVEDEVRRRLGSYADVTAIAGAERAPRYTSAELYAHVYERAARRVSGRVARHAIILPISKTSEWWRKSVLERHLYFYPHHDPETGRQVKGHVQVTDPGISTIFRRLYHNPDSYQRPNAFDFITYFECTDEALPILDQICRTLRDETQNPEWRYVLEAPEWRGLRVLRW
jgi:hypothetical protein